MKILFLRFPLESAMNGGAELQTVSLMQGLSNRGHAVAFAGSCPALLTMCRQHHLPTVEWEIGPPPVTKKAAVTFAWRRMGMKKRLMELLDQFHDLDAVVMLSLSEKLLLTDIAAARGIKVFWIEHDKVGPWLSKNPWLKLLLRQSMYATTITVSELSRHIYLHLGWENDRVVAIPNGVDSARLQPRERSEVRDQRSVLRIGCIARLSPEKGVDVLLEAVKGIADVELTIVGTGREEAKIRSMIEQITNNQKPITLITHSQNIADIYASIDALVLPSRDHDPFGMVAAEAMMLGIPVIVTDKCGIADYLHDGKDVLIVKAGSAEALREAIERLKKSEVRSQMAENGRKTAQEKFSLERMIKRYETVFAGN
ncbi:MAG TPA: glycosyltransferase family 4 protein [Candidatus Peribacteraceae bacterium]|nr:glycosyltransferase family 4 protein [Candidatus Peribacteraceae bacterium]